jgi:leader peptidase (prepilin peptidase) / N-methyltransferase
MELVLSVLIGLIIWLLGSAVGSFLNVVIYRVPAGLSVLFPPSRCPQCLRPLKAYDNVPVLGWLWLRGRCRFCRTRIPSRYPLVEAATGILFLLVYWAFGLSLLSLGYWVFLSWLLALSLIDLDTLTLPNSLTQSGLIAGLLFQAGQGWAVNSWAGMASHIMGGILGGALGLWLFELITIAGSMLFDQTAMGGGDAKLAAMMGAWLGWKLLLIASFLACMVGAFAGGGAMALGLISRRQPMPFGPSLAVGAMLAVFFGEALVAGYLRLFFPGWV